MIIRAVLLILLFATLAGFCLWGLKQPDRSMAWTWVLRIGFLLALGLTLVVSISFLEGLNVK